MIFSIANIAEVLIKTVINGIKYYDSSQTVHDIRFKYVGQSGQEKINEIVNYETLMRSQMWSSVKSYDMISFRALAKNHHIW